MAASHEVRWAAKAGRLRGRLGQRCQPRASKPSDQAAESLRRHRNLSRALWAVLLPILALGCASPSASPSPTDTSARTPAPGPTSAWEYEVTLDWSQGAQGIYDSVSGGLGHFYFLDSASTTQAQPRDVVTVNVADAWGSSLGNATKAVVACKIGGNPSDLLYGVWLSSQSFVPSIGEHIVTLPSDFFGCATWRLYVAYPDNGDTSGNATRLTGRGSWAATRAAKAVVTAVTITPRPVPTPTSRPTDPLAQSEAQLEAACSGTPVPGAAPYGGGLHPLVVVVGEPGRWSIDWQYTWPDFNGRWFAGTWGGPVQLIACVTSQTVTLGSCGNYTRQSDGTTGEVIVQGTEDNVRIVVASTGETLQSKTIHVSTGGEGDSPWNSYCLGSFPESDFTGSPPWSISGGGVSAEDVSAYLQAVSTQ